MTSPGGGMETIVPDSVPVFVDAVRDIGDQRMARVTYFVVSSEAPLPTWDLSGTLESPSVRALGMMGVICAPASPSTRFESPEQMDAVYDLLEDTPGLSVQIEDLWLPTDWFPEPGDPPLYAVYRVSLPLFQRGYRFRTGEISQAELQNFEWKGAISYSPEETEALRTWAKMQVNHARAAYPKSHDLELAYTEDDAPWRNPRAWEGGGHTGA